ncbi:MAG: Sulfotransferase, partial [Verrucomicrobiales bacterium]|nr:Sulfotransferase [Verrucomicrobiales bacterium]
MNSEKADIIGRILCSQRRLSSRGFPAWLRGVGKIKIVTLFVWVLLSSQCRLFATGKSPPPVTFDYDRMSTVEATRAGSFSRWFHKLRSRRTPKGYTPIDEFQPEDVFIVGYPKSGNTWFQNLISGLIYGVDSRLCPTRLVNDIVPDVHFNEYYHRYSTPMFFKSHSLPRPDYRRVVYLLRDGRDAMVSYFHYLEAIEKKQLDFLALVKTGLS